jgi:enoyl-CoA hydratase
MIEREDLDGVAVVRLAHGKVNALDIDLCRAITETFRGLATDASTAIVFTGSGSSFCAGVDLWRIVEAGPDYVTEYVPALVDAFTAVFELAKPVVAALNGHAIAGGCVLACGTDYRLMVAGGIGVPEGLVGVPFPAAALEIVTDAVGPVIARRAVTTGQVYRPEEALALGFVDAIVGAGELVDTAVAKAAELATAVPPDTYAVTKRQLRAAARGRIAALGPEFDAEATEIWRRRAADGWIADYMAKATGKSR